MARPQKFWTFWSQRLRRSTNVNTLNGFDPMIWSQLMAAATFAPARGIGAARPVVVSIDGLASSWRPFVMQRTSTCCGERLGNYRDL